MSQKESTKSSVGTTAKAKTTEPEAFITRSCDMCRKKKIRCEPFEKTCIQCLKYKTLCHFTPIGLKRKPRRPPGQKRVEELEDRLKKVEAKLREAKSAKTIPVPTTEEIVSIIPPSDHQLILSRPSPKDASQANWAPKQIHHVPKAYTQIQDHTTSHNPVSSLLPILQNLGLGMTNPAILFATNHPPGWSNTTPDPQLTLRPTIFSRRIVKALPPKAEALFLIHKTLQRTSNTFPIFTPSTFLSRFSSSESPYDDPAWWACINVILALAHRFRSHAHLGLNSRQEDILAWGYFQNALSVLPELTLLNDTLASVQALTGMASIVQGAPNQGPCASLTSSAMKLAQMMGMHRAHEHGHAGGNLPEHVREERKRIFWVVYILDRDMALRTTRPPMLDDGEIDVEPITSHSRSSCSSPGVNSSSQRRSISTYLPDRIALAKIQSQVYKRLFSLPAQRQSYPARLISIQELSSALQAWRANVPVDFMHNASSSTTTSAYGNASNASTSSTSPAIATTTSHHQSQPQTQTHSHSHSQISHATLLLRLAYFATLSKIHSSIPTLVHPTSSPTLASAPIHNPSPPSFPFPPQVQTYQNPHLPPLPPSTNSPPPSLALVSEARQALYLIHATPQGNYACIWIVLHIFVSATHTLLTHLIAHPSSPHAREDLELVEPLLRLLSVLARREGERGEGEGGEGDEVGREVKEMWEGCSGLWERARRGVEVVGLGRGVVSAGAGVGAGVGGDEDAGYFGSGRESRNDEEKIGVGNGMMDHHVHGHATMNMNMNANANANDWNTGDSRIGVNWTQINLAMNINMSGTNTADMPLPTTGRGEERESVEDFIRRMEDVSAGYGDIDVGVGMGPEMGMYVPDMGHDP